MGVMISFGDSAEEIWVRQSMIYRTILRDVIAIAPRDEQVLTELEGKLAVNGLLFDLLDTDLARRILLPLKQVVVAIVNDKMLPGMTWKETCISRAYEGAHQQ